MNKKYSKLYFRNEKELKKHIICEFKNGNGIENISRRLKISIEWIEEAIREFMLSKTDKKY